MEFKQAVKQDKFENEQAEAALNIIYTANYLEDMMRRLLKQYDINHEQYNVLRILRGNAPGSYQLNEISDRMLNRWSNVSRLVEKLYKKGFVDRRRKKEDRRKVEIEITDKGLNLLSQIDDNLKVGQKWKEALSRKKASQISELLDEFRVHLKEMHGDLNESE